MYAREISKVDSLTDDEEAALLRQVGGSANWDDNKEAIARRLIENRLGMVFCIAKTYAESGVPMLDLVQEGNLGLFAALNSYAVKPSGSFGEYATRYIEGAISKAVSKRT
jgi:RNA polymerase primary sigma factor